MRQRRFPMPTPIHHLVKTISGLPLVRSLARAVYRPMSSPFRPRMETISPLSKKDAVTETA